MADGLEERHRRAIIGILAANPKVERAVLFGSRAKGTFSPASDIDIALFGRELAPADLADLKARIEETTIPQMVDLLLYQTITNEALQKEITEQGIAWYRRRNGSEK